MRAQPLSIFLSLICLYASPFSQLSCGMMLAARMLGAAARGASYRGGAFGHPYYYYENLDGGHSGDADLAQVAELDALQMVYFTRKLMAADGE